MAIIKGSQISGSVASASFALTASYALNAGDIFPFSGSAVITGSLLVTGGITGSMNITNLSSGSYTESFANESTWTVQHNLNSAFVVVQVYDLNQEQVLPQGIDLADANTAVISFPSQESGTAVVMVGTPLAGGGGGGTTALSASYATTASYVLNGGSLSIDTGSFATTGSNTFRDDQIISGSVYVSGGLSVGDSNIRIDTDEANPFIVGYGSTTPNIKTNTVLGYFVINSNTTGHSNVGIGFTAMQNNTTGHSNVGIGVGALGSSDAGFKNVGIGYQAAGADVVYSSVAVGYWALRGGGGNSTAVGYEAGKQSTTISYRNVYIGYGAGPTASLHESDKLYIANAAGTPLIGGDFNTEVVTINGSMIVTGSVTATSITGSIAATNGLISGSAQLASSFPLKTVGTWTVPAGASVQSFTVDWNHSYQMWVIGNIPSGIISWNATVNVTNANVPIVGSQYSWYYVDGNALVLTSIPAQIVGVNGAISTASYSTTTSNTFEFGITNNSGTTQTITYGYVKLS